MQNIDFVVYLEPKLAKQKISKNDSATENEIIYLIEGKNGNISAKIAKVNGEITTGGVNEEPSQLSDYKITLPKIQNGNPTITLDTEFHQDPKCQSFICIYSKLWLYISNAKFIRNSKLLFI